MSQVLNAFFEKLTLGGFQLEPVQPESLWDGLQPFDMFLLGA